MPAAPTDPTGRRRLFLLILVVIPATCAALVLLFSSRGGDGGHGHRPHPEPRGRAFFAATRIADFSADQSAPGAVTEVADPRERHGTVLKLTVHDDDVAPITPTDNPRAQLLSPPLIEPGRAFWLSTSFLLPRSLPRVSAWLALVAVYGEPAFGPAPWEIAVDRLRGHGEMLTLRRGADYGYDVPWSMPVPRGRWVTVTVHERFALHGFIELWVDGRRVTFFSHSPLDPLRVGPTTRLRMATRGHSNGGGPNVAKIMQYRQRGQFAVGTVYFDGLWLGTSRAAVEAPQRR